MAKKPAKKATGGKAQAPKPQAPPVIPQRAAGAHQPHVPGTDVFQRTIPFLVERHSFGEHKHASLSNIQTETDKKLLALKKRILNSAKVRAIRHLDRQFQRYLQDTALPFRPGYYLVPVGVVEQVFDRAEKWEAAREKLANEAEAEYPTVVDSMEKPLGPAFNRKDYPPAKQFRAAYWVAWRFVDMGTPGALQTIKREVFERERAKMAQVRQQAEEAIQQHLCASLADITKHLGELLTPRANGRKPQLRDGALDRFNQFLDTVVLRDVTNFQQLRTVVTSLQNTAKGVDVDKLRDDDKLRARMADAMNDAKAALDKLVTEEGRSRQIRLRDEEVA